MGDVSCRPRCDHGGGRRPGGARAHGRLLQLVACGLRQDRRAGWRVAAGCHAGRRQAAAQSHAGPDSCGVGILLGPRLPHAAIIGTYSSPAALQGRDLALRCQRHGDGLDALRPLLPPHTPLRGNARPGYERVVRGLVRWMVSLASQARCRTMPLIGMDLNDVVSAGDVSGGGWSARRAGARRHWCGGEVDRGPRLSTCANFYGGGYVRLVH